MLQEPLTKLLSGLPATLQYMVIIALVLLILYLCLLLTRRFGRNKGEQVHYDDPEAYEKQLPNLFSGKRKDKSEEENGKTDQSS